jgi:hypothetical protein
MKVPVKSYQIGEIEFDRITNDCKWITASCFLEVAKWNYLLQEMKQFVLESNGSFKFFQIRFNYENGANIRFLALVDTQSFEAHLHNTRQRLSNFFKSLPHEEEQVPITSIFLPFPSSVIEFGLYYKNYDIKHNALYAIEKEITCLLFDMLNEDELSETTIITAAFYLQIGFIKVCFEKTQSVAHIFELVASTHGVAVHGQFPNALADNYSLLLEIVADIMKQETFCDELEWLNKWIAICKKIFHLEATENGISYNLVERSYNKGVLIVSDFLGLNNEMQQLVSAFVASAVQDYYKKNC